MDILRKNTTPQFEIVPRYNLDLSKVLKIVLINENTQISQTINLSTIELLPNQNYKITLSSFPTSKNNDKFSYIISENISGKVVSLGKLMVVSQTENVQDFSKQTTNNFYK